VRYLITGGSGYIGSRLVARLGALPDTERIVIADVRAPRSYRPKTEFQSCDVRDRARVRELLDRERPDALVHLAFILNPLHDEKLMYDIDVGGTQNVLDAAGDAGTQHVLVTSSATAYGAFPDNPEPIDEEHPVRGVPDFEYARDKAEADRLCQLWALQHPERTMTIVRPCIVFGPNVDNYLVRLWTKQPFAADFGSLDGRIQFVHEDDVVDALIGLLAGGHEGAFNLAGDGTMTYRECARVLGVPERKVPLRLARKLSATMWKLRLSETPPGQIHFALWPWVVANDKVKRTLGWTPRHSSRETFEITMRAHGALAPENGSASVAAAAPAAPASAP
jgi:UDP-glucose 4-epimerase